MVTTKGPQPTGGCRFGCGERTKPGHFFRQDRGRVAEPAGFATCNRLTGAERSALSPAR